MTAIVELLLIMFLNTNLLFINVFSVAAAQELVQPLLLQTIIFAKCIY
jgi:hypothetical protein